MTYLLDTNVVSDMRRPRLANDSFQAWMDRSDLAEHYISTITLLELEVGVIRAERKRLPHAPLLRKWTTSLQSAFALRLLPVTEQIALRAAPFHVPAPKPFADALIAATALAHDLVVVTRDVDDFGQLGVRLLNPWDA